MQRLANDENGFHRKCTLSPSCWRAPIIVPDPPQHGQAVVKTGLPAVLWSFSSCYPYFARFRKHADVPLELAEVLVDGALRIPRISGPAKLYSMVPSGLHSISRSTPLACHSAATPPLDVGMIEVGSMVLSSRAFSNSHRRPAAASGLGGILPSGRLVSCQGSRLSALVVEGE